MATDWVSSEEISFCLLITLHRQYVTDHRSPVVFMEQALGEVDPSWMAIERELIQLRHRGWIEFCSDLMPGTVMCRLTPGGREVFENIVERISQSAGSRIGFALNGSEG